MTTHDLPAIGSLVRLPPDYWPELPGRVHRVSRHTHIDGFGILCRERVLRGVVTASARETFFDVPEEALDCDICKARVCRAPLLFEDDLHRVIRCPECGRRNVDLGADEWTKTHGHLGYACVFGGPRGLCILAEHRYRPCHYPPGGIIF